MTYLLNPKKNVKSLFYGWFLNCLLSWLIISQSAVAALEIEITQAIDSALPITVLPFTVVGPNPPTTDLAAVIRNNLARSGEFSTLDEQKVLSHRAQASQLDLSYWRRFGTESVLLGTVTEVGPDRYQVDVSLVDVYQAGDAQTAVSTAAPLLAKTYTVSGQVLRSLAHHISDEVYQRLIGERGAFSTRVAYVSVIWGDAGPSEYRLEIADADGENPRALKISSEPLMSPSWSPDGKQLAYVSFEQFRAQIYITDVQTGATRVVSRYPGINGAPAWSPDGKQLALVLSHEDVPKIFTLDLASGKLTQVTDGWSIDTEPSFMPDGKHLVFTSNRGGGPQIYQVNIDSKRVKRLTFEGPYNARSSVTPDGRQLVMIHQHRGRYHIATQNLTNGQVHILTQTALDESPSLSPNGRMIIYGTVDKNRRVLGAVSTDGRVKLLLPANQGDVQEPAWSPFLT